jgi:hypothetical protein
MMHRGAIFRWAIPILGGVLVLALWGAHSLRHGEEGSKEGASSKGGRSSHPSGASSATALAAPEGRERPPRGPTPPPGTSLRTNSPFDSPAASPTKVRIDQGIEESFMDLRVALAFHDRALGEKVYPMLIRKGDLALRCAQAFLLASKDPSDREVAERAMHLLTAPPTHGLLKHFQW